MRETCSAVLLSDGGGIYCPKSEAVLSYALPIISVAVDLSSIDRSLCGAVTMPMTWEWRTIAVSI